VHRRLARAVVTLAALLPAALGAQIPRAEYAARRAALARALPGDGAVLAVGAEEPTADYLSFYQRAPFLYLTGFNEPNAYLLLVRRGGAVTATMFVQPKDPAREVWTGRRVGPAGAEALTGVRGRDVSEVQKAVDSLAAAGLPLFTVGAGGENGVGEPGTTDSVVQTVAAVRRATRVQDVTELVAQLRATKTPAELDLIRRSVEVTVAAHREAMAAAEPGMNEFELQALVEYTFRRNGADRPSFASIIGSGPNSTTLHYSADDRFMRAGEVAVMDIGASYRGYAADVTRTIPVSGTFTPAQREIYQLVRDAQAAAERAAKVDGPASAMMQAASGVVAAGLARLGLIESADATYDCAAGTGACPQWRMYFMHGLGHGIGLDVHDPDQYYASGVLAAGSAFTIEPGVYVRENLLEILPSTARNKAMIAKIRPAVERYRNIGVRIEDDYVVTARGVEWISRAPREIAEVEAAMRGSYAGPAPRDPARVEWYRKTQ
jgi:Xaa-Pro aminopeptidase